MLNEHERKMVQIRRQSLEQVRKHVGQLWKEVQGEYHGVYDQLPTWVLLYDNSDIQKSHAGFVDIVAPYFPIMGTTNFTVTYCLITNGRRWDIEYLGSNQEILDALNDEGFAADPSLSNSRTPLFQSADSKRDQ